MSLRNDMRELCRQLEQQLASDGEPDYSAYTDEELERVIAREDEKLLREQERSDTHE